MARAESLRRTGKMRRIGGLMDASGTILEGATSADRQRKQWQDTYGSLSEDEVESTLPTWGGVGDWGTRLA